MTVFEDVGWPRRDVRHRLHLLGAEQPIQAIICAVRAYRAHRGGRLVGEDFGQAGGGLTLVLYMFSLQDANPW